MGKVLHRTPRFASRTAGRQFGIYAFAALPFFGMCVLILMMAMGTGPLAPAPEHNTALLLMVLGGFFGLVGIILVAISIRVWSTWLAGFFRTRHASRESWLHPCQVDYAWDETGASEEAAKNLFWIWFVGMATLILLWALSWGLHNLQLTLGTPGFIIGALLGMCGLSILGWALYLSFHRMKFGKSRLHFCYPSFTPGGTLEVTLAITGELDASKGLTIALLCCEEQLFTTRDRREVNQTVIVIELHESRWEFPPRHLSPTEPLALSLPIPAMVPGTHISCKNPRYWVLQISAAKPGIDYKTEFLVPIYSEPNPALNSDPTCTI